MSNLAVPKKAYFIRTVAHSQGEQTVKACSVKFVNDEPVLVFKHHGKFGSLTLAELEEQVKMARWFAKKYDILSD